jgi:hypothetical protein
MRGNAQAHNPVPPLSPYVAATLEALRADGIEPTDAEIAWLATLRVGCDTQDDSGVQWLLGAPVKYGGEVFWPMHMLAEAWFLAMHNWLQSRRSRDVDYAAVFLFAHAKSATGDKALREPLDREEWLSVARKWLDNAAIHDGQVGELCKALRALHGGGSTVPEPDESRRKDAGPVTPHAGIAILCKTFPGTTPDYWLTDCAAEDARAYAAAVNADASFATSRKRKAAIEDYLRAVRWIRRRAQTDG